ncbi:uncharacterized protein LOC129768507 [Toxorhynchites rutilus septentrionalis]|uniref:uncharacterized protein LOC129768507 n=1 Tax=Toxorhynchites rutilus septentrionalis TaxID=329112 RepID=UPI00247962D0|nr:uncharacterized protein LOC129768507 [Toxorhynchites rutilus septentrionalis]XP_055626181.1 uncharacterized protein LOC129768507 [Toxorhynchites rutilus septentrionalis]
MENLNFPPVEFERPACYDEGSGTVFQEFAIILQNFHHFKSIPTERWLSVLQEKAIARRKLDHREADRLQNLSVQMAENDEADKAMIHITQALFRCPPDSILAKAILCQKGELLRRKERMQDAIRHLEQCLRIEGERFSFGTYLCLLRCYKAMGNAPKVKSTLGRCATFFNRWKDEFQRYDSQLKNEPDAHMEEMKKEFDLHANCIPKEIVNDKSFHNEPAVQDNYEEEIDLEPFMGFSSDSEISGASSACSLDMEEELPKLVANRFIPEGSIVLIERPFASHLEFSKVQCYVCHIVYPHLIPCFNCHGVFYCSYQCQRLDSAIHKYECRAYQLLFFPLVNGNLEIRMLIRTLDVFKRVLSVKGPNTIKFLRTANDFIELLLEGRAASAEVFNVLLLNLDYTIFRPEDFDALMIKTEKLLSYVKYDGQIRAHYFYQCQKIDDLQFDIIIGGLLLHFCTLTMSKVSRLSFEIPATEDFVGRIDDYEATEAREEVSLKNTIHETLKRYGKEHSTMMRGKIDADFLRDGVLSHLETLRSVAKENQCNSSEVTTMASTQVWTRANVKRLWQGCLESVNFNNVQRHATSMYALRRGTEDDVIAKALIAFFDSYFEHFGDIPMCSRGRTFPNSLRGFYPTMMKLKHSCGPNLFYSMISNGLFVARARRDINEGEELTLNHGPHYKDAPREERREYLKKIYIDCDCIECGRIDDHWIRYRRVKCEDCLFNTNAPQTCLKCLQSKEVPAEMRVLIEQLQDIESCLSMDQLTQLLPVSTLRSEGLQTVTALGRRKMVLFKFFERVWAMIFVDAINVPTYNTLKEQLSCFVEEVIRDSIDGIYILLERCKNIIDTLFPYMSVRMAKEYEFLVRRTVKYMIPAKFLAVDMPQVFRTIDLARSMTKLAALILEGHFLYDDENHHKLMQVKFSLQTYEEGIRLSGANDESELFLDLINAMKRRKDNADRLISQIELNHHETKTSDGKLVENGKKKNGFRSQEARNDYSHQNGTSGTNGAKSESSTNNNNINYDDHDERSKSAQIINPEGDRKVVNGQDGLKKKSEKNVKRKETGAIPKPSRTTKHHRKV